MELSARQIFDQKKNEVDAFYDKPFLRSFIRAVQKINPDIMAIYFPETYQLVFVYRWVIIYKIILNKTNLEDISVDLHLKNIRDIIRMLRNNILPSKSVSALQQNMRKNFNKFKTGKLL
jgi:hypothetical protein